MSDPEEIAELDGAGALIKWARKQSGATQQSLSDALGLGGHMVIANWETGRRQPLADNFIAACQACGFDVVLQPMESADDDDNHRDQE